MFRRLSTSLPKDPIIPKDLVALGYFINEDDQIRQIQHPDQKYQYRINRNERVNEMHKEAMNACIRAIVLDRLYNLDLEELRLPLDASATAEHTTILVSKNLKQKKRITIVFGERNQDLGVFSYRVTCGDNINRGSAVDFVSAITRNTGNDDSRGVILANPGQLLWNRGEGRAITHREWMNLPRISAVHDAMDMEPVRALIPGNRDYREHVQYIFEHVMRDLIAEDVKFELIGLELTGKAMLNYLVENWKEWAGHIAAICLGSPQHTKEELVTEGSDSTEFADFISKRCRAYIISAADRETLLTGREDYGCNCYASGEELYQEDIIIAAWGSMLRFFNHLKLNPSSEEADLYNGHEIDVVKAEKDCSTVPEGLEHEELANGW